ncbi:MAG TPA: S9 family peptidase [Pseudacidobacterium sp.]|jgi:dipeptidyl aminopeptidase/acylaminoacyl peptidase|nr:S9 family peptidase [Pseudacidobacterium sp.]
MRKTIARQSTLAAITLTVISSMMLNAQQASFPSNEDLRHTRMLSRPLLSPDGSSVLIQVADATADGGRTHLWLADIKENSARQLTYSPASDKRGEHDGAWMTDGSAVLFLAKRGEHTQLFSLPMEGGEAHPYELKVEPPVDAPQAADAIPPGAAKQEQKKEPAEIDIERFFISPDGKWIALVARDPQTPGEKKQETEKADAQWVDHDEHRARLYLLDPATSKITRTEVTSNVESVAWSRKGEKLLAIAEAPNNASDLGPANSAWILKPSDPGHPEAVKQAPSTITQAVWSEDGKIIYLLAQADRDTPPGYHDLSALTLADGSVKNLSRDYPGTVGREVPISIDGKVLQGVQNGMQVSVARFGGDKPEPLKFDTPVVTNLNTNARHSGWVWIGAGSTTPQTLFFAEKLGHPALALNAPSTVPAKWTESSSQLVHWQNEGQAIEGLLYLPPQAKNGKVPLIVDVHGGPTGAWEDSYAPLIYFLLGHGWAVLRPNPRGSTGYGAVFAAANKNDLGGADYRDIMAGVDTVIAHYPIDPEKLALMGYSYGGEMAGFVEGKTDRFKGVVSGAPVIDQYSEYGTESSSWYDRWFYGKPWERGADAWRQSPLSNAGHAKTPFLLLQGDSDTTDPIGQSLEMYRALRQMNVPVDLVRYPREDHGPLATGVFGNPSPEPWHGFDARQRIVKFFEKAFAQ